MELTWETGESWFKQTFAIESGRKRIIDTFEDQPTLDELRQKREDPSSPENYPLEPQSV